MNCVWQCEIDDDATEVLSQHWPRVKRHGDIRTFEPTWCDVICGGFPCQDISKAGKCDGLEGARSGLWSEYLRIIREVRPRFIIVENVSALLVFGMGRVLGDLAASGYDAEWDCIPAAAIGAAHLRDRVFIVAYTVCESAKVEKYRRANGGRWIAGALEPAVLSQRNGSSGTEGIGTRDLLARWEAVHGSNQPERGMVAVVDGVSDRLVGNAVMPQIGEWIGRKILSV
jgi:DNA (cytosine-5)-methyltransferase 1